MEKDAKLKWVTSAKPLDNYILSLTFNDGSHKLFDCKELIENNVVFKPLKDKTVFNNLKLDGWTVSWNNGTIDIAPEYLYDNGIIPASDETSSFQAAEKLGEY